MRRSLLLFSLFLAPAFSYSQGPTLVSFEVDTLCQFESGEEVIYNLQVFDPTMDSTWLFVTNSDPSIIQNFTIISPPYIPTQTIRTFIIKADAGFALAAGLNLTDIEITMYDGVNTQVDMLNDVAVYGDLGAFFSVSTLQLCSNGNPVDFTSYGSPAGGVFSWYSHVGNIFDPEAYYAEGGSGLTYTIQNAAGCVDYYSGSGPIINIHPTLSVSPSYSTCGNADGSIMSFIGGGSAPYDIYWSTGFSETGISGPPLDILDLPAGNYYGNVTDAYGCKSVALAQISDIEVDLDWTSSSETCLLGSQDGGIDVTINTGGPAVYTYWSNGQTTEDLTGVHTGEYTCEVHTVAGCEANAYYFVPALSEIYAVNSNSTDASCSSNNGVVDYDVLGGSGVFSYLWNTGETTQDLFSAVSGTYTCVVTDVVTGCTFEYSHCVYSGGGPGANLVFEKKPTCGQSDGSLNLNVYQFSAPITSISWSSGQTTEDLVDVPAGDYEITVTASDGCIFKQTFFLENEIPQRPQICMMTVDSSLTYNQVVWEKDLSQPAIAGYRVYRETSTYGNFELVSDRPYALESIFQDNDASPQDRSWRYYLTAYDACGNESQPSDVHKTIHTVTSTTNGTDFDIYWDYYEGLNYASVDVFRFDSTNGWGSLGNFPVGTNTIADTPPVVTGLDYLVEFILADPCHSTKAQDHNSSRSNRTASAFAPGGTVVGLESNTSGLVTIYPNPATDAFVLHVGDPGNFERYEITTINGEVISSGTINASATTISTSDFAAGVYLVRLVSENEIVVKKLVKK